MIIRDLYIDGFGIFRDYSVRDLKKGVNVLTGPNEAGKSTLLDFLRYTLFGYPRSRAEHRVPLKGGRHGGRIVGLAGDPAREVTFERFAGAKGGQIRLLTPGGESSDQAEWDRLLGYAYGELYQNVYAFSLDELVGMDSLTRSGVEDRIFSIGLGLGDLSLGEVEKGFQESSDKIFFKRGRTHQVSQLMTRINELNEKVKNIQAHLPHYQSQTAEIRELEEETARLGLALQQHRAKQTQLENYFRCYEYFVRINRARQQLKDMPALKELPDNLPGELDQLETREQHLKDQWRAITSGKRERKGIQDLEQELENIHFNSGLLEQKETVDYLRENLTLYQKEIKNREDDLRRASELDEEVRKGISAISTGWSEAHIAGFEDMEGKRAKLASAKSAFEELGQKKRELGAELKVLRTKEHSLNTKAAAALLAGIAALAAVPAFYYGLHVWGMVLVLIAGMLFFSRNLLSKKGAYQLALERLEELGIKEGRLRQEFGAYLGAKLQLNSALSPEAALNILDRADQLKGMLLERDKLLKNVKQKRDAFITDYEGKVTEVKVLLEVGITENNVEIIVNRIAAAYEEARQLSGKKRQLADELERANRELRATEKELEAVDAQITLLLNSIGADDRLTLREVYEQNEVVKSLNDQLHEATEAIEVIAGLNRADEVMAYLAAHEKTAIEDRIRELKSQAETDSGTLQQLREELGGKKREIQTISDESELSETLTALETEKQKLQLAYREWLTRQLALKILGDVKTRFEQEKQPEVIRYSSQYFKKITENRYEAIRVSLGQKEVSVFDPRGAARGIGQLSRGTREQLLVSLRLGFIEAYEKQAEPLPIIVDEILVNFDPERAQKTAKILEEFAKDRQILMLTCHETTAGLFKDPTIRPIG